MDEKEQQLVRRAQAGDFDAFTELIAAHRTRLYNLALKMTGSQLDAEDIVQDTFLKAIDRIDQFRGEAAFGTWLYAITLNETRMALAREKRADLRPIEDYLPAHDRDHGGPTVYDWRDPHRLLEQGELRTAIDRAIGELPLPYREAFVLRYIDELPIKEVAELLGESVAATKSRVLRTRLAVRDRLAKQFEGHNG